MSIAIFEITSLDNEKGCTFFPVMRSSRKHRFSLLNLSDARKVSLLSHLRRNSVKTYEGGI